MAIDWKHLHHQFAKKTFIATQFHANIIDLSFVSRHVHEPVFERINRKLAGTNTQNKGWALYGVVVGRSNQQLSI